MSTAHSLLIIDDELDLAQVVQEILQDHFSPIHVCTYAEEAMNFLAQNKVSVILSDISMPGMNGDEMLQRLRMRGIHTPVVFLTGNATKDVAVAALKLGASDFLEKPFEANNLIKTLNMAIEIEAHRQQMVQLETMGEKADPDLLRSDRKTVGILQASRTFKKSS